MRVAFLHAIASQFRPRYTFKIHTQLTIIRTIHPERNPFLGSFPHGVYFVNRSITAANVPGD